MNSIFLYHYYLIIFILYNIFYYIICLFLLLFIFIELFCPMPVHRHFIVFLLCVSNPKQTKSTLKIAPMNLAGYWLKISHTLLNQIWIYSRLMSIVVTRHTRTNGFWHHWHCLFYLNACCWLVTCAVIE